MKTDNTKVTGANISIKLDDEFMLSLMMKTMFIVSYRCGRTRIYKINSAKSYGISSQRLGSC